MKKLLLFALFLLIENALFAQKLPATQPAADSSELLTGLGKWDGKKVILRWAPTTPGAWLSFNQTGYVVEKTWFDTTLRHGGAAQKLTTQPLKPLDLKGWEQLLKTSKGRSDENFMAVAAQCLHGKTPAGAAKNLLDQAADLTNRHSYTLFAADMSAVVAQAAALGLEDSDGLQPGRVYVYRIYPAARPANGYRTDTLEIFVKTDVAKIIPKIVIEETAEQEHLVTIGWSKPVYDAHFSAYFIEKSTDGRVFQPLNELPYVHLNDERIAQPLDWIRFQDSVAQNYRPAFYRVVGITPFGERSEPGPSLRLMGRDKTPPGQPSGVKASHLGGSRVRISWNFEGQKDDLKGFLVGRSSTASGKFEELTKTALPVGQREFLDEKMSVGTNYYVVAAVDTAGNASGSLLAFAAVVDSFPPSKPVKLAGLIDTNGVVRLHWPIGKDADIAGYRIWSANQGDHVFICLSEKIVLDTVWTDTIGLRTLTETIFYRVQAVDVNDNASALSEMLELKKPDKVAPVSALMTHFKVKKEGIEIGWQPSTSKDVVAHEILRKKKGAAVWEVLTTVKIAQNVSVFTDFKAKTGETYHYNVRAVDDSGLRAELQQNVEATMIDQKPPAGVENLTAKPDESKKKIALSWTLRPASGAEEIILFRSEEGGPLRSIERLAATEKTFFDATAKAGKKYEYSARVAYSNGGQSPFSALVAAQISD